MAESTHAYSGGAHRRVFVHDDASLRDVVHDLDHRDALGVDLEMGQRVERRPGGVQEWKHILALIQIASDEVSVVIDPLRCNDLTPLAPLMAGPARKVFLGGGQDVALLAQAGIPAYTIVDVGEVALGIWGRREDGMAALARRMFNVSLDKTVRRADWLVRPLNPALLTYAFQDAELTLMIYRWFQEHHAVELAAHERRELDPPIPPGTPDWLQAVMRRSPSDALLVLPEYNLHPERDADRLTQDIRCVFDHALSPRQTSRLIRIIAELALHDLEPEVIGERASPSSVVRASVARALGAIGQPETSLAVVEELRRDPVEDVRKMAEGAVKDLRKPRKAEASEREEDDAQGSIDQDTMSALQALMRRLESGGE